MLLVYKKIKDYAGYLSQDQHVPQQKFVLAMLPALFVGHSLMLSHLAKAQQNPLLTKENNKREYDTREHYFSRNVNSARLDMDAILQRYYKLIEPVLHRNRGRGVTVVTDGTDYRKEWARPDRPRGMQGASHVRDGSRSTRAKADLTMGYAGITVEAALPDGTQVPMAHWLFSRKLPDPLTKKRWRSDEQATEQLLERVAPLVGSDAWWTFDRDYASNIYFNAFDKLKLRWLVRIQNNGQAAKRRVRAENGIVWSVEELAATLNLPYTRHTRGRDGEPLTIRMGLKKVFLKEESSSGVERWQETARTLLVAELNGSPTKFIVLVSEWDVDKQEIAEQIRKEYRRRWTVEETHRFVKNDWGFKVEHFRVLKLVAIQRVVFFAMLACGFMALLNVDKPEAVQELVGCAWAQGEAKDPRYRLTQVIGLLVVKLITKTWVRFHRRRALEPPPETPDRLRDRLRNAQRAVTRAQKALRDLGLTE
ncbi:MAG: transposase [Pseudomonadota bacterium]|nr:transposase [Pseudomonadota bacterium]